MADYKDPWAWMQGEQVPKNSNTLPPVPQVQAPANITGGGPGMLTNMAVTKGVNKGSEAAYDYGKGAYDSYMASQPSTAGTTAPVQGPATGAEAIQSQPLAPLSAPVEPTTAAAAQGSEIAGSAATAQAATATEAGAATLATDAAGATAAQQASVLAAQQASAAAAAEGATASGIAATNFWNPVGWAAAAYAAYKLSQA